MDIENLVMQIMSEGQPAKPEPTKPKPGRYQLLYNDHGVEIRKYPPIKRTILFNHGGNAGAFLPLPFQVYITAPYPNGNGWGRNNYGKTFAVAFATQDDSWLYPTPWSGAGGHVCVDMKYHTMFPIDMDMGEIIGTYWQTYFYPGSIHTVFGFHNLEEWKATSLEDISGRLQHSGYYKTSYDAYLQNVLSQARVYNVTR